jgi:hypothetical protein
MPRLILVWAQTAAFLVALPVTGSGQCPYCSLTALRAPSSAPPVVTAAPRKCQCCHAHHTHAGREQSHGAGHESALPGGTPCDHHFTADETLATAPGKRSERAGRFWDANAADEAGCPFDALRPASDPTHHAAGPPAPPPGLHALQYSCAFRC